MIKYLNLSLLVLFPIAWFAPLMRAGLNLPLFGAQEISVISGVQALWKTDIFLTIVVCLFAILAPLLKTIGLACVQFGLGSIIPRSMYSILGKLAMVDMFLIALYIVILKGVSFTKIETMWGLYLFSGCVFCSIFIAHVTSKQHP